MSEGKFKFFVLKGIYLIMRHLAFEPLTKDDILDYRKEIKNSLGGFDIYGDLRE